MFGPAFAASLRSSVMAKPRPYGLSRGDGIVYYSPRTALKSGEVLQAFTAIVRS